MSTAKIKVTFLGAAGSVTGSKYLVEHGGKKILVDCGLFQGKKELRLRNWDVPPFDPGAIDAVLLTHAHIDHCGYLPALVRRGLNAPVYCSPATKELLRLVLPDAARLQEEEAEYANKHGTSKHHPALPLFDAIEAEQACALATAIPYNQPTPILNLCSVTPTCAGHILGSAALCLDFGKRKISFSGDIGRYHTPLLPDPQPIQLGDLLIVESTYGDRLHADTDPKAQLAHLMREVHAKGGVLLIPAFAIGRTQTLLYYLAALERENVVPVMPVCVDSPMAVDITHIYRRYQDGYDYEAKALIVSGHSPLLTKKIVFCRSVEESKALNQRSDAHVLISASGMATGGRILHHIRRLLPKPNTIVLLAGYQAEGTRGRTLQQGAKEVKIFGEYVPVRAQVETMAGLSAHADQKELLRWLRSCNSSPGIVKVTHGEEAAALAFAEKLRTTFGWNASAAMDLEVVEL